MEVMKTTKLTKYYGKVRGIKELDLTVTHGEFFGFIGPNGAGKSTTIRTVLGLIAPTSGDAMIFGKDVTKEREAILQNIGYLPSEALFYQGMKVKDILRQRNREGTTIFLSSHVLSEIQRNCTRAAIIRDGRIIAQGSVDDLSKTSAKRITVHGSIHLENLSGVRDRKAGEDGISFLYSGDMGSLLRTLASGQVDDLTVTEPDLEEIFLHYYEEDGETV